MQPYFAIKLFGVFPSPDPKALQQVHKALFFPTQVNCRGISKEYVHIPNSSGAFANSAQVFQHRLADTRLTRRKSFEDCLKTARVRTQIMNFARSRTTVYLF